ncbi:MAG TPA: hypothetical protein DDY78_01110 [Planctomycetales bacterium]|nr:hypothetical protein [Planctomycetales bacterium]
MFGRIVSWAGRLIHRQSPSPTLPACDKCGNPATLVIFQLNSDDTNTEKKYCGPCGTQNVWLPNPNLPGPVTEFPGGDREITMALEKIVWSEAPEKMLILRELQGSRRLSFMTGYFEASALWWFLKGAPIPRPPTHDAWLNTVVALGWKLRSACVYDRRQENFFAEIRLFRGQTEVKVEVRPSDALILALRAGVPLCFTEKVLAAYGVSDPEPP